MQKIGIILGLLVLGLGILLFGCISVNDTNYTNYTDNYTDNYTSNYTDYTNYTQNYTPDNTQNVTNNTPIEKYKGGPITIKGDKEFTSANGVVKGSGISTDPYIIEGWTIDASNISNTSYVNDGIYVYDTSKYFIIRNCRVENATGYGDGIGLLSVANGKIENCTIANSYGGILIDGSYNITISGNTIKDCKNAGMPDGTHSNNNVTISNNIITNSGEGISLHYFKNSYVANNTIKNNKGDGIYITATINSTISNNIIQDNGDTGIYAGYSNWKDGDHNVISNNDVSNNNGTGISTSGNYNNITYNTINGNDWGIQVASVGLTDISAGHNLISHNMVSNNKRVGFSIDLGCVNNTISDNTIVSNNANNEFYIDTWGTKQRLPRWYDMDIFSVKVGNSNTFINNTYGTITYNAG
jgi:parallel beta-helix repeat protein